MSTTGKRLLAGAVLILLASPVLGLKAVEAIADGARNSSSRSKPARPSRRP
ncbi:MAG: hypothetical protein IH851_11995 [Armatimonadetes bacterium]|nr:hypothetical protein [Armatimonadota bacterium]